MAVQPETATQQPVIPVAVLYFVVALAVQGEVETKPKADLKR